MFEEQPPATEARLAPVKMSDTQRAAIRALFDSLEIRTARDQFRVVTDLTGARITSPADLDGADAHRLIERLQARVASRGQILTGNAWDDRTEDTWIDRL